MSVQPIAPHIQQFPPSRREVSDLYLLLLSSVAARPFLLSRRRGHYFISPFTGSERVSHTGATGLRLQEAGSINRSLAALSDVIKVSFFGLPSKISIYLAWSN